MCKSSSLSTCLMMSCGVSYRCLTIDMQRMFCQRSTLRVGNSCYIPGVMGHPKNARGCHCVLSLCHLMYCHLPNISLWRLRKFTKSQSHLITTAPATALCTWRIQNHQTTCHRVCSFTHSASMQWLKSLPGFKFDALGIANIRSSLYATPCRPHRPFPGTPAIAACSIHGGARGEELLHDCSVATFSRPVQRCRTSGAEGLGDVNGAPPRGSPPPTPTLEWKRLESAE